MGWGAEGMGRVRRDEQRHGEVAEFQNTTCHMENSKKNTLPENNEVSSCGRLIE